ncbi:MAG: efflux RND transporter periplasmic adaptor subunit [Hydrogenovibrio sp.]
MKPKLSLSLLLLCQFALFSMSSHAMSGQHNNDHAEVSGSGAHGAQEMEPEKGPHRGRMLREGDFALELAIFETGVPPEFRVWSTYQGKAILPEEMELNVKLTRLGGVVDDINFRVEGDYLRGDTVIYEPHSFVVEIEAKYNGKAYRWQYDNFEGRTQIESKVAEAMEIMTETAGPVTLHQTIKVYGKLKLPADAKRSIQARFDGEIKAVHVKKGQKVKQGQLLLTVESNESLKSYRIVAPVSGIVSQLSAYNGEQTAGRELVQLTNTDKLIAELAVYPMDAEKVHDQTPVTLSLNGIEQPVQTQISGAETALRTDQAKLYWAEIDNSQQMLSEGLFITAEIEVDTIDVPLAVKQAGLQSFRDFTVVYAKVGEQYEVRMLELGRSAGEWVEVLGGLNPSTEYVTTNSYIIKADIEKSGASHDH